MRDACCRSMHCTVPSASMQDVVHACTRVRDAIRSAQQSMDIYKDGKRFLDLYLVLCRMSLRPGWVRHAFFKRFKSTCCGHCFAF